MSDTLPSPHKKSSATAAGGTPTVLDDLERRLQRLLIKQRIAQAREESGLTQPEFGDLMQPPVHWRTVQEWESQKNNTVPFGRIDRIAEVTNRSSLWILHGDEETMDSELRDELTRRHEEILGRFDQLDELVRTLMARAEDASRQSG